MAGTAIFLCCVSGEVHSVKTVKTVSITVGTIHLWKVVRH